MKNITWYYCYWILVTAKDNHRVCFKTKIRHVWPYVMEGLELISLHMEIWWSKSDRALHDVLAQTQVGLIFHLCCPLPWPSSLFEQDTWQLEAVIYSAVMSVHELTLFLLLRKALGVLEAVLLKLHLPLIDHTCHVITQLQRSLEMKFFGLTPWNQTKTLLREKEFVAGNNSVGYRGQCLSKGLAFRYS